jgi:HicB family
MSALSIRLPESLHNYAKEYALHEGISVNQLISTALAEKLSALATEDYLELRAQRGNRKSFDAALARVPDAAPDARDRKKVARKYLL